MAVTVVDIVIGIGLGVFIIYLILLRRLQYWKKRNVVTIKSFPLIGSYLDVFLIRKHRSLMFTDQYNQYPNEKVIGGFRGLVPELILRDPDLVKCVLIKDFNYFNERPFNENPDKEPLSKHLFLAKYDLWKRLRPKLTPTFTSGKMKKMFPLIAECGEELQSCIQHINDSGHEHEIREIMSKYTTDVIGSCAFGIKIQSMKEDNSPFRKMGKKIFDTSTIHEIKEIFLAMAPRLFYGLGLRIHKSEVEYFFFDLFKKIIRRRETEPTRHDFIDLLRELKSKAYVSTDVAKEKNDPTDQINIELTDKLLAAQAFVFFAAGFETSSTTMSYCLHELAFNPDVQKQLIDEINAVINKHDGQVTYDAVQDMKYLDMVINETLRKHPPGALVGRTCNARYTFPNINLTIDKGVQVTIPLYAFHHDPQYYPEPEKFDPERFNLENSSQRHPSVYLPFGDGPRNCIGMRFGKLETAVGLISVLRLYSVEPSSKSNPKINYRNTGLILSSKDGIWLKLKKRHNI